MKVEENERNWSTKNGRRVTKNGQKTEEDECQQNEKMKRNYSLKVQIIRVKKEADYYSSCSLCD